MDIHDALLPFESTALSQILYAPSGSDDISKLSATCLPIWFPDALAEGAGDDDV